MASAGSQAFVTNPDIKNTDSKFNGIRYTLKYHKLTKTA